MRTTRIKEQFMETKNMFRKNVKALTLLKRKE